MESNEGKFAVIDPWGGTQINIYSHSSLAQIGAILHIFCIMCQTLQ